MPNPSCASIEARLMQDHFWYRPGAEPAEGEADTRPGFKIRMASLLDRGAFDAELEGRHHAAPVPPFVMLDTAIAGVHALLEDEAEEVAELLRSFHGDADAEDRGAVSKEERAQIAEIESILAKSWPPYRQLVEQNARYRNLMPLLAFQRFVEDFDNVTGLDGKPVVFERDKAGTIPDALLRRIHPALLYAAGNRAYNFQYAGGEEKN
jgi:hypothetical protein